MWKIVGAILVGLEVLPAAIPLFQNFLPLGGTPITQVGIVLGTGFVLQELRRNKVPAKNRMSVSFSDKQWSLLERIAIHSSRSKSEIVSTIIGEFLDQNPDRFRVENTIGLLRTEPLKVVTPIENAPKKASKKSR
jgi:hypothetical protein